MRTAVQRNLLTVAALVAIMVAIKLFDMAFDPNHVYPGRLAAFPWVELAIVTGAGAIGAVLAARTAFISVLPPQGSARRALGWSAMFGLGLGIILALLDAWLRIGDINVGLPLAPLFYLWGGISQELITHFAPTAVIVGIASVFLATERPQRIVFWIVAIAMSALAALGMMSAFQNPAVPLDPQVAAAPMFIGSAVFVIELALFWMLARAGLLAALAMRLGFYAIWHIAWPALAY